MAVEYDTHPPSQRLFPVVQAKSHCPASQIALALGCVVVQTWPHAPQLFGSVILLFVHADPEELPDEPLDPLEDPLEPDEPDAPLLLPEDPLLDTSSPLDPPTVPSGPASPMVASEKPQRLAHPAPKTAVMATIHAARIFTRSPAS